MMAIELNKVNFSYDEKENILEDINFKAEYGKVTLLSGHSGSGKSTLMYIISGIIPNVNYGRLTGDVLVDGTSIVGKTMSYICRKVGVVLQNADEQIIQNIVEDEIAFGCENLAFSPSKITKQIEVVTKLLKLDPKAKCRTLSGGQKQRLITASTLAMGQKIIILDEPLANLDKEGANSLMLTLKELAKVGYAVVVIEHRLDMVLPFVDIVYHMENKKLSLVTDKDNYLLKESIKIADICPNHQSNEPLFNLTNISFNVEGEKEILKDINLDILKGSRNIILGENGCGKTTLLRLIARLYKPTSGKITQTLNPKFKNNKPSKAWYKKVGVVYQNPDYQLFMPSVWEEIKFGAINEEYAHKLVDLFGLTNLLNRHPQSLSEGQKRKLTLACVLAAKPEVLLLDEPTAGQDYDGLCTLTNIINTIHNETNNTIITITHDIRCAEALCDNAFLIGNGVVLEKGGKELVKSYFKN